MHLSGNVGVARANAAAHFLIERDELPLPRDAFPRKFLPEQFRLRLSPHDDFMKGAPVPLFISIFNHDELAYRMFPVANHMRRLSPNHADEFGADERAAVYHAN